MVEAGILAPDERVELIEGQLYRMPAKGTFHSAAITRIKRLLEARLGNRVLLRFQDSVRLSDDSESEPDVAVVRPEELDYENYHPTPYVYREPRAEGYASFVVLAESDLVAPLAFPDCQVPVEDLLRRSTEQGWE